VTDSDRPQRFWLHTALLQAPDGTLSPAFVIDERAYPDQAAARADLNEAFGTLQRAGVPAQFEAVSVRAGMAGGRVEPSGGYSRGRTSGGVARSDRRRGRRRRP
jgi:hypothetical protein